MTDREQTFLRLLSTHDRAMRRLAASYEREPARQQDLVQDIWLALWEALPRFRGDCSERTFTFRIAHNCGVSHIQRWRRRHTEVLDEEAPMSDPRTNPEQAAGDRQRSERLKTAVFQLPLGLRQVTVLMLEGLSHREIGEVLGITENNVAVRLARARATLANTLGSTGSL